MSVSVGIAAFNEEKNIKYLLQSVLKQSEKKVFIKEIIVISDGSTDGTIEKVKEINDKKIRYFDDQIRMGQPSRINQLLKIFKGQVLVTIDADFILKNSRSLENISVKLIGNKKTGLVAGKTIPLTPHTFTEKAIFTYLECRSIFNKIYHFGRTAYGVHGFLAYSRKFVKKLTIPENILNFDAYTYFFSLRSGFQYQFADNAQSFYRLPQTFTDYKNQAIRYLSGGYQLYDVFGRERVLSGFFIPKSILIFLAIFQFIKNPLGYSYLRIINTYFRFKERVYAQTRKIPKGKVATYGQIAKLSGNPKAARAVGVFMKLNPSAPDTPCHRVVAFDGNLTGYSGKGGLTAKKKMLKKEGVKFTGKKVDLKSSLWHSF